MYRQATQNPTPVHEDTLLQIWLTGRISDLLELASSDLEQACREFDALIPQWGTKRVRRALGDLVQDFQK